MTPVIDTSHARAVPSRMLLSYVCVLVMVVGLVVYALAANPKAAQIGYVMLCVGMFFTVALFAGRLAHLP